MRPLRSILMAGVLALAGLTSCVSDPGYETCTNFDDFLYTCYYNCAASFECEDRYQEFDEVITDLLDECGEKLGEQAYAETCNDATAQGYSCEDLMLDYLGGTCDF